MTGKASSLASVGLFCGSSFGFEPGWAEAAARFGRILAEAGVRLVYGGGAVGLMGACARAVVAGGGRPLGVIPEFLMRPEVAYEEAELVVVGSMHERKARMFEAADAFAVLPGGIGTLEEVIELMSWARFGLHAKPIVFYSPQSFWAPLLDLIDHTIDAGFTPAEFAVTYRAVERIEDVLPVLLDMSANADSIPIFPLTIA